MSPLEARTIFHCEFCDEGKKQVGIIEIVMHLNDEHELPLEDIADLIELADDKQDWLAALKHHQDGSPMFRIQWNNNSDIYGYPPKLFSELANTREEEALDKALSQLMNELGNNI